MSESSTSSEHRDLRIDGQRLWASIEEMARIGSTPAGGSRRLALSPEDGEGRALLERWGRELGLEVQVDAIGNQFLRREGRDPQAAPVMTGSHLDTQPTGGRFDGVYGVLAGLEILRTLADRGRVTRRPIEVVNWTNEEGSRFHPACLGSGVWVGQYELESAHAARDRAGTSVREALEATGQLGPVSCHARPVHAYIEAHIEQGPVLEAGGEVIGAVTGIQGKRAYRVKVVGMNAHAGTTPMAVRRDPLVGASRMVVALDTLVRELRPDAVVTVGEFEVRPGSINVINQEAELSIDLRCPEDAALAEAEEQIHARFDAIADEMGLECFVTPLMETFPTRFDDRIVALVETTARDLGHPVRRLVSGAGHDAKFLARACPTGMIFIPCRDGISHNETEDIEPAHAIAGADVLLQALVALAEEG